MSKVVSSYESVVRGVSEQAPHQRISGQHFEQVNMVSDPVRGLARRQGSITLSEWEQATMSGAGPVTAADLSYFRSFREYTYFVDGREIAVMYPTQRKPVGRSHLPLLVAFDKSTGAVIPVAGATDLSTWDNAGFSSVAAVGQFLCFAGNGVPTSSTRTDKFAVQQHAAVASVRSGAYSRTYTLRVNSLQTNTTLTAQYTTMASSYPNLLDTSDIPASDPEYQKKVNDRVYAYNAAVTKWIGDAMRDIQPQNIADKLRASLSSQGHTAVSTVGGTVILDLVDAASADDSADGTSFRATHVEVDDPVKLSAIHRPYKVVRVAPKGAEPYYMEAIPDNPAYSDWQTVTWKESARIVVQPQNVFMLGCLHPTNGMLYVSSTPAALQSATGLPVPGYNPSVCGDPDDVGGQPYFMGRQIHALSVFQDRLIVVSNGVIFGSRTGDYFNWFRKSKLTVVDDDPVEMYALGAEDDTIRHITSYNRDLFLFGERKQYAVSGRTALTPRSAAVSAAASERDTTEMQPVTQGNLVFYAQSRPAALQQGTSKFATTISQFQLGLFQDTPETYPISQQLSLYLRGKACQGVALTGPNTLMLRTDGYDYGIYTYTYMDQQGSQSRAFDSWSRWEWSETVGRIVGMTHYKNRVLCLMLRVKGSQVWFGVEQFTTDASESDRPYLDMQRSAAKFAANDGFLGRTSWATEHTCVAATAEAGAIKYMGSGAGTAAEYDNFIAQFFPGDPSPEAVVGVDFDSYVELTPPYTRDRNGVAVVNGRLVVTRYTLSVYETGGMDAVLIDATERMQKVAKFNGRRVGMSDNLVGRQPSSSAYLSAPCGRANTEHRMRVQAHTWLPLTVTAVSWTGQYFNHSRQG